MMLFKIAWRNVWRNKVRSITVMAAIALGLWAGVFVIAFYFGIIDQRIKMVIESEVSHFQVHNPLFPEEKLVKFDIKKGDSLLTEIRAKKGVVEASGRLIVSGMVASPSQSTGLQINGISPTEEARLTHLDTKVKEGEYLNDEKKNKILVSTRIAKKLKLKMRSKVVLTFQNIENEIVYGLFRVGGIFKTGNGMYDERHVFVRRADLSRLLEEKVGVHEIAVLLEKNDLVDSLVNEVQAEHPDLEVKSWMDISPGMRMMTEGTNIAFFVILTIIMIALIFGIINTMLMAILERVREIGMLMAVGMSKSRVFGMIMLETLFLALIGGPVGLLLGYATITYFGEYGLSMASYGEMYENLGYASTIYTHLSFKYYAWVAIQIFCFAILASIYPAYKALSLNPVEAIRKI